MERSLEKYSAIPPTFFDMDISLSLSRIITLSPDAPASFMASRASPPVSAPSPITATEWYVLPVSLAALANPSAAEIEVLLWPVLK